MADNGTAGDTTTMTCISTGFPAPFIYWMKNGTNITDSDRVSIGVTEEVLNDDTFAVTSDLTISGLVLSDTDMYSCVATNFLAKFVIDESEKLLFTVLCKSLISSFMHRLLVTNLYRSS